MKRLLILFAVIFLSSNVFAQKGVDTQTKKINQESSKTIQSTTDNTNSSTGRVIDFGKGKTGERKMLANPYKISSRRDIVVAALIDILKDRKLFVDEASSRLDEGVIITQPYIFARGTVISPTELNRYAVLPASDAVWKSGRYSLRIDVESIDGLQNNVSVTAKVDGKAESGLISEWTTLPSTGVIEDEILTKLVENIIGISVDEPKEKTDKKDNPDN